MRPDDLGELTIAAALGGSAGVLVGLAFWRGSQPAGRVLAADLLCLLGALAFFAVFFDALHTITYFRAPAIAPVFALIEDGGEMLVVSAMTAYAFDIVSSGGRLRIRVWSWIRNRVTRGSLQEGLASTSTP